MLSNHLISLSVNPVSQQRPPAGCHAPRPRVPAAPRHRLIPPSSKTGLKPQSLKICRGKVTGGHGGERLWNESAGRSTHLAPAVSQASILMVGGHGVAG